MYGQTNCFVLPEGEYGAYKMANEDVLIVSHRAARGLAYQVNSLVDAICNETLLSL
jgi:leucyl-tRNA synthetase